MAEKRKVDKDHQLNPKLGKGRGPTSSSLVTSVANKILRSKPTSLRGGHPNRGRRAVAVRSSNTFSRRVIIKARIVKMTSYGSKAAKLHIKYIERDGVERDGTQGELYGKDKQFNRDRFLQPIEQEPHQFRVVISPEDAGEMNLTDYTREVMRQVEKDLGRDLNWAAVNHYNTDNPHTHVVIRGVDLTGEELRIDRQYISHGLRHRSQEIATQWLGPRTSWDIEKSLQREISQQRFTSLDRQLEKFCRHGVIDFKGASMGVSQQNRLMARLQKLSQLTVAKRTDLFRWKVTDDWQHVLKKLGEQGDIIKNLDQSWLHKADNLHWVQHADDVSQPIEGRVVQKGLADELNDRAYLLIETPKNQSYYIKVPSTLAVESLRENDIVLIKPQQQRLRIYRITSLSLAEQSSYPGRTWLDQFVQQEHSLLQEGYDTDIHHACEKRKQYLREQGIDLHQKDWPKRLDQLERQTIAIKQPGEIVSLKAEQNFTGQLNQLPKQANGHQYARIDDLRSKRFALVPWQQKYTSLLDQTVAVQLSRSGQIRVRAYELERGLGR